MPDEIEQNLSSNSEDVAPKTIKPRPRKPKPLVEGINSPKNTNDVIFVKPTLTDQEKRLISNSGEPTPKTAPRLLSKQAVDRATKKGRGIGSFLLWLLFFLLVGFGAYEIYGWYSQK